MLTIDQSLTHGGLARVLPGVQLTYTNIVEKYTDSMQDFCDRVCLPTFHAAITYEHSGFQCGMSEVDSLILVPCPYVDSLAEAVSKELRERTVDGLPAPLMSTERSNNEKQVIFKQFVGYGACYTNVTITCANINGRGKEDGEVKTLIILSSAIGVGILACILAILWIPSCMSRGFFQKKGRRGRPSADSNSTSLGVLDTKDASVKTYLMGQINGERLGISDDAVEITEQIASGGYGVVYKGTWKSLPVAIKTVIFQDVAEGAGKDKQRAIFEAAISSSIAHRNVVQTYTYSFKQLQTSNALNSIPIRGDDFSRVCVDWKLYIVQELCEGGSLRNSLKDRVLKSCTTHDQFVRGVIQLALDIAEGLLHLHNHNIIHGDVNTKNVLLREDTSATPLSLVAKVGGALWCCVALCDHSEHLTLLVSV